MSEAKHTPGPWEWVATAGKNGGSRSAMLQGPMRRILIVKPGTVQPSEADAALLKAAPDLLAALVRLLEDECVQFVSDTENCECGPNGDGTDESGGGVCGHIQARRAIAKATGGQPV